MKEKFKNIINLSIVYIKENNESLKFLILKHENLTKKI